MTLVRVRTFQIRLKIMTEALELLCANTPMPDVQFIAGLKDAVEGKNTGAPVFAFAGEWDASGVIMIPDFEILGGQGNLLEKVRIGNEKYAWHKKSLKPTGEALRQEACLQKQIS